MKAIQTKTLYVAALLMMSSVGLAQSKGQGAERMRYFRLTFDLKTGTVADGGPNSQRISTEVGVRSNKPGSSKARLTFQVPYTEGARTEFIELGTKLDCNGVRIDGDGIALNLAVETSRVVRMIKMKGSDGVETEEPLISKRAVSVEVKLTLDETKVVFDSSSKAVGVGGDGPNEDLPMRIELTAMELK